MSAKKAKSPAPSTPRATAEKSGAPSPALAGAPVTPAAGEPSWMDSSDPRKRLWGKILLVAVWLYVAALGLLALDKTFHLGIFGPATPPIP
jgi:hypothetical protein